MKGEITKQIMSCMDEDGWIDHKKFSELYPSLSIINDALEELERKGFISVDRSDDGIADFEPTLKLVELRKQLKL